MKKVLVLNGSPKAERSDTFVVTSAFINAMQNSPEYDVEVVNVIRLNIKPCLGCFACWKKLNGQCIQNDDQNELLKKYIDADIIIYSFPLYCYAMPSQLKAVVDRLLPLNKMTMTVDAEGRMHHERLVDQSKKKLIFICGSGFPNFEGNFESLKMMIAQKFGKAAITICVSEAPSLNQKEAEPVTKPLIEKFRKAGEVFADTLSISEETKKELEVPMIPNEMYIKIVNSQR